MIEIKGLDSLMQKLDSMGGNVLDALDGAVKVITLSAKSNARDLAPKDTGMLKLSVSHEFERDSTSSTGTVYAFMPYAIHQELGTYKMDANPYMMPAFNAHRSAFKAESAKRIESAIKKLGG